MCNFACHHHHHCVPSHNLAPASWHRYVIDLYYHKPGDCWYVVELNPYKTSMWGHQFNYWRDADQIDHGDLEVANSLLVSTMCSVRWLTTPTLPASTAKQHRV